MRTEATRQWIQRYHGANEMNEQLKTPWLSEDAVQWILKQEGYQTHLIKCIPANGDRRARWQIRQGNYITLGELFVYGAYRCTCWDLYRTYRSLDVFIHRKPNPTSNSEEGIFRQNAKRRRLQQTGKYDLPR